MINKKMEVLNTIKLSSPYIYFERPLASNWYKIVIGQLVS